jgi:hypothetical protein
MNRFFTPHFALCTPQLVVLLAYLIVSPPRAAAQTVISGFVQDAETGAPLPEATVQVEGGFQATVTNAEGRFDLAVASLPVTLLVSRIGYFSQPVLVDAETPSQRIRLVPSVFDLDPVIVTEHESVEDIMRRVIERKKEWRARLKSLNAEGYARFSMENDTAIVFIVEGLADVAWNQKAGWKAYVKSFRRSSNRFVGDNLDDLRTLDRLGSDVLTLNMYDDNIRIGGHWLMGVTHPDALKAYRFQMLGQRLIDNRIVYDIGVTPKSKLLTGFVGRISVVDKAYAMMEADLQSSPAVLFPPPLQDFSMAMMQQFAAFGDGFWLPVGLQAHATLKAGIIGLMFPRMKINLTAQLSDYRVVGLSRQAPADSVVPAPRVAAAAPARRVLLAPDDSLVQRKMIPLTEREKKAYVSIDTNQTFIQAFEPKGFIAGALKRSGAFDEKAENQAARKPSLTGQRRRGGPGGRPGAPVSYRMAPAVWYNRVDAAHIGLTSSFRLRETPLTLNGMAAYRTGPRRWAYGGGFTFRWGPGERHAFSGQYLKDATPRQASIYPQMLVSPASLLGQADYFDYFLNERVQVRLSTRLGGRRRWMVEGGLNLERHRSLPKTSDYALFGIDRVQRPNPAIAPGSLRSLVFRGVYGREPGPLDAHASRYLSVTAEVSHPDLLGSDFSFARYDAVWRWRIPTWFKRRMLPNTLDVRIAAGVSQGTLPLQRFGSLDGSPGPGSPMGVFRSLRYRPYEGEHYAGVFWDHNFRTVPFELLGLRPLARRGIGMSVYGGHGRTWISDARLAALPFAPSYQNRFHHEVGVAINGLLYFFRLDFTKRLDASGFYVGLGIGPGFVW